MAAHDILDNRERPLSDEIRRILDSTESARFAVGYFFASGLEGIADRLERVSELRLLIGNTTNRQTLEQMAEGFGRLELVVDQLEAEQYRKSREAKAIADATSAAIRDSLALMDQTDEGERVVTALVRLIQERRLKVKVYTKGRLHAKAYIFTYAQLFHEDQSPAERAENGIAIVGSSNLTLAGISHNTELNVVVHGNENHAELCQWFDELWDESEDFDARLMQEMKGSWAGGLATPYDIYMKTLYTLVQDRLEGGDDSEILWSDDITEELANFQEIAVRQAIQMIKDYGGAFVADVVGLGKSYIGAAIVKHFERSDHARPLIICPATLVDMWDAYNETYQLNARVLSMAYLVEHEEDPTWLAADPRFRDRDFVLIDESHNFRHSDTQRYRVAQSFLAAGKRCCFLTATPRNKSAWDIYFQIKLFHQDDITELPIHPANLRDYFNMVDRGERTLPELLSKILVRRTRNHILRWYGFDAETNEPVDPGDFAPYRDGSKRAYVIVANKPQFFPRRELKTIEYSIEATYLGLYERIRDRLGRPASGPSARQTESLCYARYGLWNYLADKSLAKKEPYASLQRSGRSLTGLMRILLFKRFESSVHAFRETVRRLLEMHLVFLAALDEGTIPAGKDAQKLLYRPNAHEEQDLADLLEDLSRASSTYIAADFEMDRLKADVTADILILRDILKLVGPITAESDDKLTTLKATLATEALSGRKCLVFTEYADTAQYLFDNLNPDGAHSDISVIYSGKESKASVVGRFAPKANPEYRRAPTESEIRLLIATDVLAEGLNLQDCDSIINYDLHWNPVKLIQRFGRIDRIGSENETITGYNFLPELGIERNLGLHARLAARIQEIHDTIGEDGRILDKTEQLNPEAMYAIYEQAGGTAALGREDEDEDLPMDISEAEEKMRVLRDRDPDEFQRILGLRDGIRSATKGPDGTSFVFCGAGRYHQLMLVDSRGRILERDVPSVLNVVKCSPDTPTAILPKGHNKLVTSAKRVFEEEVQHRQAQQRHTLSLSHAQRYALRELKIYHAVVREEDIREQVAALDQAFRLPMTSALNRDLNRLRRNGVAGKALVQSLRDLYNQHGMREWKDRDRGRDRAAELPRIICSEGFVK